MSTADRLFHRIQRLPHALRAPLASAIRKVADEYTLMESQIITIQLMGGGYGPDDDEDTIAAKAKKAARDLTYMIGALNFEWENVGRPAFSFVVPKVQKTVKITLQGDAYTIEIKDPNRTQTVRGIYDHALKKTVEKHLGVAFSLR